MRVQIQKTSRRHVLQVCGQAGAVVRAARVLLCMCMCLCLCLHLHLCMFMGMCMYVCVWIQCSSAVRRQPKGVDAPQRECAEVV